MSKQSRARAAAKTQASASNPAASYGRPNPFFIRWGVFLAGSMIVLAALAAYHNSLSGPFVLDDQFAITGNPTIRRLGRALSPPTGMTTGGRPLINLTFALNYALDGLQVRSYHALNLLIHALAGLVLFGLVRRTLLRPQFSGHFGTDALPLALTVAAIWTVHPVQTEAVTYISQRAESLMGLFYLLTLYCFIRSQDSGDRIQEKESGCQSPSPDFWLLTPGSWLVASVFSCLLGALSKEIIVTAPVMVLLYDRTFVAGSFHEAWRLRWRYYLGLACTWLLLACLMTGLSQRVGLQQGVSSWNYALTSCRSVVRYCQLAVWPHPLVFDYGTHVIQHATEAVPYALVLAILMAGVAAALLRWPVIGFAGAWFFVILAPTSSVVPLAGQPMAEHRLYLSLAAVVALGVLGLHRLIGRRSLLMCAAAAVGLGWLTVQRNQDYQSELAIWSDTVDKCPDNEGARDHLGIILANIPGRLPEAIAQYEAALRINPDSAEVHNNLGTALLSMPERLPDAMAEFKTALRIKPDYADAQNNLGNALAHIPGRMPEAMGCFKAALRIKPDFAAAHDNLGNALSQIPGRLPDAVAEFKAALRINPDSAEAHYNLGDILLKIPGRLPESMAEFQAALRIEPNFVGAQNNLGYALVQLGRLPEAVGQYEQILARDPDNAGARKNLELIRKMMAEQTAGSKK